LTKSAAWAGRSAHQHRVSHNKGERVIRYFIDTEFIEDGKTIELLSIAIVAEDGRELYRENGEADTDSASEWVQQNVIPHLHACLTNGGECKIPCPVTTHSSIRDAVTFFCDSKKYGKPEFWGYYSAYDHVALCQLFGTMMDLPEGWPYYTRDLRQWLDERGLQHIKQPDDAPHHALKDAQWIAATFKKQTGSVQPESRAANL